MQDKDQCSEFNRPLLFLRLRRGWTVSYKSLYFDTPSSQVCVFVYSNVRMVNCDVYLPFTIKMKWTILLLNFKAVFSW